MIKTKPQRYKNLILEINACKPKTIIEIGTWIGDHAKEMIETALKHVGRVYYFGFDLFEHITDKQITEENSKQVKAEYLQVLSKLQKINNAHVSLIMGNTKETLANQPAQLIDFIFIDGGHSLETIESDWKNIQKFIHDKTVIIFDDYYDKDDTKGCRKLIHALSLDKWRIDFLQPIDQFDGFTVQMIKVTKRDQNTLPN